jgi:hypothetical protein
MTLQQYQQFWKAHLRPWSGLPLFPRDISSRDTVTTKVNGKEIPTPLNRSPVINEKQYIHSLSFMYNKKDCYVQVFSDWQIEKRIFDTIFFELADAHPEGSKYYESMDEAMAEIMFGKHIVEKKLNNLGIAYRNFYTAGRGFHYFLDFEPVFIKDYKATLLEFFKSVGLLDLVDTAVVDSARISRIPYTKHLRTGNYAIYTGDADIDTILDASKNNKVLVEVPTGLKETSIMDYLDLDIEAPKATVNVGYDKVYIGWYPECVIGIMEKILVNQHATHDERKHLAGYLMRFRLNNDQIMEYFMNTSDFNRDVCLRQIESLADHSGYSCRNVRLILRDLCPGMCEYIRQVASKR